MRGLRHAAAEEHFCPYRHLAIRVLVRALLDAISPNGRSADRESARDFLNGSGMLLHWCRVAAIDPTVIVRMAEKLGGPRSQSSHHRSPVHRHPGVMPAGGPVLRTVIRDLQ